MQCGEVMDLLSAYYDGELSTDKADSVSVHVSGCAVCAAELETLHKLSDLTARLDQPAPPSQAWPRIAAQLDTSQLPTHPIVSSARPKSRKTLLAIALLLLASVSWFASTQWHVHDHHHLTEHFGVFLDSFEKTPDVGPASSADELHRGASRDSRCHPRTEVSPSRRGRSPDRVRTACSLLTQHALLPMLRGVLPPEGRRDGVRLRARYRSSRMVR